MTPSRFSSSLAVLRSLPAADGRLARGAAWTVLVIGNDGTAFELDAESGRHAGQLAAAWIVPGGIGGGRAVRAEICRTGEAGEADVFGILEPPAVAS